MLCQSNETFCGARYFYGTPVQNGTVKSYAQKSLQALAE